MRRTCVSFLSSLSLLVSSCEPLSDAPLDVAASRAAIVNGVLETGYSQVVAVARTGASASGGLCSGTVLGDYLVLTAKHCVFEETSPGSGVYRAVRASDFLVIVGYDIGSAAGVQWTSPVYEVRSTPGSDVDTDISNGDDMALLLLPTPVPADVPRSGYAMSGPAAGEPLTIVGFGRTRPGTPDPMDAGVKHRGSASVNRVGAGLIESTGTSWTCQGDSGGPAFDSAGNVTGITSFGPGGCTSSQSYYSRVARHRGLIADALSFRPPCMGTLEVCDGVDNDCDGVVDPGCTALGGACSTSEQCSGGRCELVSGAMVCVRDCDPSTAVPRCPFGFWCEAAAGCGMGRCVSGEPGGGADGDACATALDCESNNCTMAAGAMRCGRQCSLTGDPCPAGDVCEMAAGAACGVCLPVALSTGPRSFGAPCDTGSQCASTSCGDGFCTRACDTSMPCPTGFHCRAGLCARGDLGGLGASCETSADCGSTAPDCVDADGERVCSVACVDSASCMLGFECSPTDMGDHCVRPGLAFGVTCTSAADCRSGVCGGVCTRECSAASPCPTGYDCVDGGSGVFACFRTSAGGGGRGRSSGGCAAAGARGDAGAEPFGGIALGLALGLFLVRKRPSRRSRA